MPARASSGLERAAEFRLVCPSLRKASMESRREPHWELFAHDADIGYCGIEVAAEAAPPGRHDEPFLLVKSQRGGRHTPGDLCDVDWS